MDRRRMVLNMGAATVGLSATSAVAQRRRRDANSESTPVASDLTPEELVERVEELEEENRKLKEENERLKQRINDMSGQSTQTQDEASEESATAVFQVGETWSGPDWSITVTGYEISPTISSSFETNTARGVYSLVYLTVVNESSAPVPFPYDDLQLMDSDGRTYTVDEDSLFNLTYVIYEVGSRWDEFQPGIAYSTAVAFDIPPTSTGLVLTTGQRVFDFQLD